MRIQLLIAGVVSSWLTIASDAEACKCAPPDRARSYEGADDVVHVRIQRPLLRTASTRSYLARLVEDDFKGCLQAQQGVIVETPSSSAACGMSLQAGEEYVLYGKRGGSIFGTPRLRVISCDANVTVNELTADHRKFLDTRYVCCGGKCACADDTQPVQCFADPCQVSSCNVDGATCSANYCGGCNAEWHDQTGALVCEAPSTCNYDAPDRDYVARDPRTCTLIDFICTQGQAFFDSCGCGCTVPTASTCQVAGCSGQLCIEPGDPGFTTCEWREEYACYQSAHCERQASGGCGWTQTPELMQCLEATR